MTFGRYALTPKVALHGQHLCAICLGWADWTQCVGPKSNRHIFHCVRCKSAAKSYADMSDTERKKMRCDGVYAAADKIGAYLDRRGKTDFAAMSEAEWYAFLHEVLNQYEAAIREITRKYH